MAFPYASLDLFALLGFELGQHPFLDLLFPYRVFEGLLEEPIRLHVILRPLAEVHRVKGDGKPRRIQVPREDIRMGNGYLPNPRKVDLPRHLAHLYSFSMPSS